MLWIGAHHLMCTSKVGKTLCLRPGSISHQPLSIDFREPVTLADALDSSLTDDAIIPVVFSDSDEQPRPSSNRAGSIPRRRGKNGMSIRNSSRSIGRSKDLVDSDADSERSMEGSGSSLASSSSRRHRDNNHNSLSQPRIHPDIHSDNLQSPLSPLDPPYPSLRHKPSQTSTLTEPDTPLASLVPPANFAEQFKYIICSSGLLDPTTKLDQKRASLTARSRYASEVGGAGFGRPGSFVSTLGYGTDPDTRFQERDRSRLRTTTVQPIHRSSQRPFISSNHSQSSLPDQYTNNIRRPQPTSRASCSSTTYLTASSNSSRSNTPTMGINPLPIVDFDEPIYDSPISPPPVILELPPGLRQRKRKHNTAANFPRSTSASSPRRSDGSWSSLISSLIKFALRSTLTLTGYMWVWGWINVNVVLGIGSWMVGFAWKVLSSWISRRQAGTTVAEATAGSTTEENEIVKTLPVPVQSATHLTAVEAGTKTVFDRQDVPADLALPTPDIQVFPEPTASTAVAPPSLQASALDMMSHLVTDNETFESAAMDAFDRLSRTNM